MSKPPGDANASRATLDRSALAGAAWSGGAKWSTQLIAWAVTIWVARILTPADYGLVTMATVFLSVVAIVSEFGIGTAVVTMRELPPATLSRLHGFSLLLGGGGLALTAVLAVPISHFFRSPDLPPVLLAVGTTFLVNSIQTVPAALLRRDLAFRRLAMIEVVRGVMAPAVMLAAALLGMRYWSLVLGTISGAVVSTALVYLTRPIPLSRPSLDGLRDAVRFSSQVLVGRLAWVIYQDGDFAVAGRRLSAAAVGDYSLAWNLATNPIEKLTNVVHDIAPGLFSAIQGDKPALRRYFLNISELISLATFPVSVGIALVSQDFVTVVLGPRWDGAAAPLAVLSLYAGARSVAILYAHVFNALRDARFAMWVQLVGALMLLSGFIAGSAWGPTGIAIAWLAVHPLISVISFSRVARLLDLEWKEYLGSLRLGLDGVAIMAAVVLTFQGTVGSAWSPMYRLLGSIALGATSYGTSTALFHRSRLSQILTWFRQVRNR